MYVIVLQGIFTSDVCHIFDFYPSLTPLFRINIDELCEVKWKFSFRSFFWRSEMYGGNYTFTFLRVANLRVLLFTVCILSLAAIICSDSRKRAMCSRGASPPTRACRSHSTQVRSCRGQLCSGLTCELCVVAALTVSRTPDWRWRMENTFVVFTSDWDQEPRKHSAGCKHEHKQSVPAQSPAILQH